MKKVISIGIRGLVAAAFIAAAVAKLMGSPEMIALFAKIGLGDWFRYFTAAVEVGGAALLFWPGRVWLGAALLSATMVCAALGHLFRFGGNPAPALILLALCLAILWTRRGEIPFGRARAAA